MKKSANWDLKLRPWVQIRPYIGYKGERGLVAGFEAGFAFGHVNVFPGSLNAADSINVTEWTLGNVPGTPNTNAALSNLFVYEKFNFYIMPNIAWSVPNSGLILRGWYRFGVIQYGNLGGNSIFANMAYQPLPLQSDGKSVDSITTHQVALQFEWSF